MPITLQRLSEKMGARAGQVDTYAADAMRRKMLAVGKQILKDSPIDTGQFVGGWRTTIGVPSPASPSRTGLSRRAYSKMKRNRKTKQRTSKGVANAKVEEAASLAELQSVAGKVTAKTSLAYIANAVPHATILEKLGSKYAPRRQREGFVMRAVAKGRRSRQGKLRSKVFTK